MTRHLPAVLVLLVLAPLAAADGDARAREIDRRVAALMRKHGVPGVSVSVINGHKLDWARGYGVREAGQDEPVGEDTIFQAGSVSKPVTAVAALVLVEQGVLDLDASVNRSLKAWRIPGPPRRADRVTLRHLLSHRAGLNVHGFDGYFPDRPVPSLLQVLNGEPPANSDPIRVVLAPGTKNRYSGGGYCVLQQLLLDVTGKPFPPLLRGLVLEPVGMRHSSFEQPPPAELARDLAVGHRKKGRALKGKFRVYPEMAAAGLWTTPTDLARLVVAIDAALAGGRGKLLSRRMATEMLTLQGDGENGLGWEVDGEGEELVYSHNGVNEGYYCSLIARPALGAGLVIMTNSDNGSALGDDLEKVIRKVYGW